MHAMNSDIQKSYDFLLQRFGKQHWWPARTRLEMMLGAILTQNTAWSNVEKAISGLRKANAINLQILEKASQEKIAEWIRPAGYFNQKAGYIKTMIENIRSFGSQTGHCASQMPQSSQCFVLTPSASDDLLNALFALDTPALRKELLSWNGIGPETADSILLYAAKRPVFVVDAYTKRVCSRHGWCDRKASYDSVAKLFTDNLPEEVQLYNEYHALIVRLCKEHCTTTPKCDGCPLGCYLR